MSILSPQDPLVSQRVNRNKLPTMTAEKRTKIPTTMIDQENEKRGKCNGILTRMVMKMIMIIMMMIMMMVMTMKRGVKMTTISRHRAIIGRIRQVELVQHDRRNDVTIGMIPTRIEDVNAELIVHGEDGKRNLMGLSSIHILSPLNISRRKSTVPDDTPKPPKPARDFYDRLFWYGFDSSESDGVGDKTVFGGTKGKFSGLAYLQSTEDGSRSLPSSRTRNYYDDYEEESDDFYEDDDESMYETPRKKSRSVKPPNDFPLPRTDFVNAASQRAERRRSRQRGRFHEDEGDSGDWVSNQVSNWFNPDMGDDKEDMYDDRSRRQRRQSTQWSPSNVIDAFFGVNREELKFKADMYNEKMGIGPKRRYQSREVKRRPGYAYRYDRDEEEEDVVDTVVSRPEEIASNEPLPNKSNDDSVYDAQENGTKTPSNVKEGNERRSIKEKSWEERALDIERVPPAGVPAWGASGELDMDARTKAIMDALEDVQTASSQLEAKQKREALAREDITVLKV